MCARVLILPLLTKTRLGENDRHAAVPHLPSPGSSSCPLVLSQMGQLSFSTSWASPHLFINGRHVNQHKDMCHIEQQSVGETLCRGGTVLKSWGKRGDMLI